MQVGFNPYRQNNKQNFCALSAAEIVKHTKSLHHVTNFETDVARGAIKLDAEDIVNLTKLYKDLKEKKDVAVSFVLNRILNPK